MKSLNYRNDLLKETLLKNYQSVILIIFLMVFAGAFQAISVLGIMPIIDVILNQDPNQHSEVTRAITNQFEKYNLPVNVVSLGVFYFLLIVFRSAVQYLQNHVTNVIIFREMRRMMLREVKTFLMLHGLFFRIKIMAL